MINAPLPSTDKRGAFAYCGERIDANWIVQDLVIRGSREKQV